ncbi:MAG TPA: hypothetical protein VI072_21495 [Polyangiaceae bacterium]
MDLAFEHAEQRKVVHGYTASVAPPRVVAVLKMTAYCDRPVEREHDLEDIAHLWRPTSTMILTDAGMKPSIESSISLRRI